MDGRTVGDVGRKEGMAEGALVKQYMKKSFELAYKTPAAIAGDDTDAPLVLNVHFTAPLGVNAYK